MDVPLALVNTEKLHLDLRLTAIIHLILNRSDMVSFKVMEMSCAISNKYA